tara:strand:+ start:4911 stop:5636 length:726 start_codon:yes stop_codon:yes gene_type:complete
MADFWIKIEKSTPDKPEVFEMAEILGVDPDAILGKLIRVWAWMDSNSDNGHIKSVTNVLIDRVTMSQGFADAMKRVGWLGDGEIPNFERHLGESAKKRAKDAERKRKSRNSSDKCPQESVTESGLDKSRVDKSNKTLTSPAFADDNSQVPYQKILDSYHEKLPALPKVQVMTEKRKKWLKSRWKETSTMQTVERWAEFFGYVGSSDFLMGRTSGDRVWSADFEWLINASNFVKVIEGQYHQ